MNRNHSISSYKERKNLESEKKDGNGGVVKFEAKWKLEENL